MSGAGHDARTVRLIVVHHSASDPFVTRVGTIQAWHAARFKFGIGYHRVIERDGFVMDGRTIQRSGAHAPPNANRLGICAVGWNGNENHTSWAWTRTQWRSLVNELHYWCARLPTAMVCGHNQTKATLCPGLDLEARLLEYGFEHRDRIVSGRAV